MSGYTPIFRSIFQGTLCGKYPELPVWLVLLALADRHGEIDAHPSYIATVSGLPQADIEAAIQSFCKPDDASRSQDEDGRRLTPIPGRGFGWTIVNHGKYREKARLAAKSEREVETGRNAERMSDRRRPPVTAETAADRPSYSDTNTNSNREEGVPTEPCRARPDLVREIFDHWRSVHGHPTAKLDDKRKRLISAALKTYPADDLREAISGYLNSPHHMGQNDRSTKYDGIELMLRDAKHIDAGLKFAREPPRKLSSLTRRNVSAVEDWRPPEVRNAAG